jgi:hypothetical protein
MHVLEDVLFEETFWVNLFFKARGIKMFYSFSEEYEGSEKSVKCTVLTAVNLC